MNRTSHLSDAFVQRFTHGHERHGQRWHLHLPREGGEAAAQVRPLLVLYPPYRALYADLLPRRLYARAQA